MSNPMNSAPLKILFVDDNRIIRHLLRLTFSDSKRFEILEAESAELAVPIVLQQKPAIIILDIMMPGELDGFQLCQMIKSSEETKHSKIILLSAKSQQEDLVRGREVGADRYITKPFSPTALIELVEELQVRG